ncbi:hypothetical protein HH212_17215 [Massilia forsythiae]|uniref:Uncharacterized protein n=1 Tax=Massilia forsythiae TaxID=2728020 RepID=A0A7Z2VZ39_9BURK|nr:hypothetical protein [Massilia forsythiae]QJE01552.1 hypothetical protein HH212_17215 [Massilia forsythiae]
MNFETKIKSLCTLSMDGRKFPVYNSNGAQIYEERNATLVFLKSKGMFGMDQFQLRAAGHDARKIFTIKFDDLAKIGKDLGNAYMTINGYRRVLDDPYWQQFFHVRERDFTYIEGDATKARPRASLPCFQCGLVLPADLITIDHSKPQAGGGDHAVLKVLRNLNYDLTHHPGVGQLATAHRDGTSAPLHTKAGRNSAPMHEGKAERYTLTDKGITVLSVLAAATSLNQVYDACMHSAFNLRPYCSKCNTAKSNAMQDLSMVNDA